ncbi:MAG: GNAT family N-acetyltransferase [Thermomicrobiales bacterium]
MSNGRPLIPGDEMHRRLVKEDALADADHDAIKRLLIAAFPQTAEIFAVASYWGARPEYRLWLEGDDGEMVAHLDFERRVIRVGGREIVVAGVGEVATHPDWQQKGLGRRLMREFHTILCTEIPVPFGFLNCLEAVAGFYTSVGWRRMPQSTRERDRITGAWAEHTLPAMVLPAVAPIDAWPCEGLIDLCGAPW